MPQTALDRARAAFQAIESAYRKHVAAGRCLGDTCEITAHVEYLAARTRLQGLERQAMAEMSS